MVLDMFYCWSGHRKQAVNFSYSQLTKSQDSNQDIHKWEEFDIENEGVEEVGGTKGSHYCTEASDGEGEGGSEDPDREKCEKQRQQEIDGILEKVVTEQSILQSCKQKDLKLWPKHYITILHSR